MTDPVIPPSSRRLALTYYRVLGLHPTAGDQQIRQAYRDRSRRYHPDTTKLPPLVAKQKFQRLNEAYGILSNPERRRLYDLSIGYSRFAVVQPQSPPTPKSAPRKPPTSVTEQYERTASAYLDATDRPLSPGELFALFILGLAFVGCFVIAIVVGLNQDALVIQPEFAQELGLKIPPPNSLPPRHAPSEAVRLVVPGN